MMIINQMCNYTTEIDREYAGKCENAYSMYSTLLYSTV
jgi:hypothetical protein